MEPLLEATKDWQGDAVIKAVKSLGQICDINDNKVVDRLIETLGEESSKYSPISPFIKVSGSRGKGLR